MCNYNSNYFTWWFLIIDKPTYTPGNPCKVSYDSSLQWKWYPHRIWIFPCYGWWVSADYQIPGGDELDLSIVNLVPWPTPLIPQGPNPTPWDPLDAEGTAKSMNSLFLAIGIGIIILVVILS